MCYFIGKPIGPPKRAKDLKMNQAEKLENAVAKALGNLAYNDVFIYPTSSEMFVRIELHADSKEVATLRLSKKFILTADTVHTGSLLVKFAA